MTENEKENIVNLKMVFLDVTFAEGGGRINYVASKVNTAWGVIAS